MSTALFLLRRLPDLLAPAARQTQQAYWHRPAAAPAAASAASSRSLPDRDDVDGFVLAAPASRRAADVLQLGVLELGLLQDLQVWTACAQTPFPFPPHLVDIFARHVGSRGVWHQLHHTRAELHCDHPLRGICACHVGMSQSRGGAQPWLAKHARGVRSEASNDLQPLLGLEAGGAAAACTRLACTAAASPLDRYC